MLEKIKEIINAEEFTAQSIIDLIKAVIDEIFAFITKSEGWEEETTAA